LIPEEGATAWVDSWMLSARAGNSVREVAHAFIEFRLQVEQQATITRSTSYGVTNIYASRHMTAEKLDRFYLADGSFLARLILWQPLSDEPIKAHKRRWERVRQ
jgi:spermidine/putrescine-binding protein